MDSYTFLFSDATIALLPVVDFGYSSAEQRFEITKVFTEDDYVVWTAVYVNALKVGTLPFILGLDSGYGVVEREVSFVDTTYHEATSNEGFKVVQFIVETVNIDPAITDEEAAALVSIYRVVGTDTPALLARIEQFATVDTLVLT